MMKPALLCVLFLCSSPALARDGFGVLIGTVTNAATRQPAPGLTVHLYTCENGSRLQSSTVTDENGSYRLPQLPPGFYELEIFAGEGHYDSVELVIVRLNQTYRKNVMLEGLWGEGRPPPPRPCGSK
jgi:5-hydroxyisourate hydrolase-like protein (transthyretin family)